MRIVSTNGKISIASTARAKLGSALFYMLHWYYRWLHLRRGRRRSLRLSNERYPRRQAEPGNIFSHSSIQDADSGRSSIAAKRRRQILRGVLVIIALAALWFVVESIRSIGIFSG